MKKAAVKKAAVKKATSLLPSRFPEFLENAKEGGYLLPGKQKLCLALLVAALLRDNCALAQLQDLHEEHDGRPRQWLREKMLIARKIYRGMSRQAKAAFRLGARQSEVY